MLIVMSLYFILRILVNKCSSSCNVISNPYAKLCVSDIVKNMNIKVFNLISLVNETKLVSWHETCICKCRLDASICNDKQRWNDDNECKELIDKR